MEDKLGDKASGRRTHHPRGGNKNGNKLGDKLVREARETRPREGGHQRETRRKTT